MNVVRRESAAAPIHNSGEEITEWQLGRISPTPSRVPIGWALVRLTSVAKLESGHTPSRRRPEYWSGDIPWISLHDSNALDVPEIFSTAQTISKIGLENSSARLLPKGTVVFSRTATVGKTTIMAGPMATSQDFANYICGPRIHNHYLVHLFRYMEPEWKRLMAGSTHNSIYMPVFENLQILLPSVIEQEAIAEALSDADALIDSLEQLLAKKRQIKQGAMQDLLTAKKRLPGFSGAWEMKRLGDLGDFLKGSGVTRDESFSGHLACIRYGEIYTRHNNYIKMFYSRISRDVANTATRLRRGDILFAGSGETKEEIGKCVAFVDDIEAYAGGDIVILRTEESDPLFLGYYLNSAPMNRQKASRGQGDAVVHIGSAALADIHGPFPTKAEQTAIAIVLADIDAEIDALETKLAKARQIKQGMMQELLTGRIRLL